MEITPAQRRNAALALGGGVAANLAYGAGRQAFTDAGEALRNVGGRLYSRGSNALRQKLKRTRRAKSGSVAKKLKPSFDRVGGMGLKRSYAPAVLLGRFRPVKRARRMDPYQRHGVKVLRHLDGGTSGVDSVVVGGTPASNLNDIGYVMGCAFFKYIFRKHCKFFPDKVSTSYNPQSTSDVHSVRFVSRYWDSTSNDFGDQKVNVPIANIDLDSMAKAFASNVVGNPYFYNRSNGSHLFGYELGNGATTAVFSDIYPLSDCFIRCYAFMNVDVQNVTQSDAGTSSTSVVDTNPLKGMIYHVRSRYPYLQDEKSGGFSALFHGPNAGLVNFGVGGGVAYRSPLPPASFRRCTGAVRVTLRPGGVKRITVPFRFDGRLKDLIIGLHPVDVPGNESCFGVCRFLHLEKAMNTGPTVNVAINYNSEFNCGAYIKKVVSTGTERVLDP